MRAQSKLAKLAMFVAFASVLGASVRAQDLPASTAEGQAPAKSQSTAGQPQTEQGSSQVSSDETRTDEGSRKGKWHVRLGTVTVAASYLHAPNAFYFGPYLPYSLGYSPYFYDPFYWPAYAMSAPSAAYAPGRGKVELAVDQKDADVYLDDFYAGTAAHLRNMWLVPGAYNLSVAGQNGTTFHQRIYVISGKSLKVKARLERQDAQATPQEKQP